ncbi:16S rRNA (uracil(1498)-N(3))-methyltransferase [Bacillus sp. FJAT-50079]|uniref:16S rRNA (uracil(1498)-N(3))-methyltransferase n=1 Tax=Bacillus sp. FJAT-50079 TaxID=2833577 RepID=UPI001BC8E73E|nr:16S rRNA (uracil(1498)-N(3))-methyltransferase [Bacillus sp. FJAT-50079]MBS4209061.1 16S rRNA (uracil(1498)-N(3))-methyltransferase [Bacillus sp. FJAT-50079]
MQRYFIQQPSDGHSPFVIDGDDYHHIVRVMRMKIGDVFLVVFPDQQTAKVKIDQITDQIVEVSIIAWEDQKSELPLHVTIASGLPKGDKLEWIIQKGTELGASEFVPFNADRSIVKWEKKKAAKKVERWNKIAKEAAEQSHRQVLPAVHSPMTLNELLALSKDYQFKIIAYEEDAKQGERSTFARLLNEAQEDDRLLLIFGPEGGLSDREIEQLTASGFERCGLGPRILRTETAPLYALSAISYQFELMR